jgi:tRNA (cmo5U34)-methyltransferase
MRRDEVFLKTAARPSEFEFNAEVAEVFDDMLVRSIPFYLEQQYIITEIGRRFWLEGTDIYDLGCSTATTLINLCREIEGPARLIGYDSSIPMLERAKRKIKETGFEDRIEVRYGDLNGDLSQLFLENASVVTTCWTLQFINPLRRDNLIKWISNGLVEGGALVVTEKVLTNDTHMNRFFNDFYYDFKRRNRYSEEEILRKREALENVLIPYRIDENLELFRRNGFQIVETFFQWYNFAGFLCVKPLPSVRRDKRRGKPIRCEAIG